MSSPKSNESESQPPAEPRTPPPDWAGIRKRWTDDWLRYACFASSPIGTWDLGQIALADVTALLAEVERLRASSAPPPTVPLEWLHHALRMGAKGDALSCQMYVRQLSRRVKGLEDLVALYPGNILRASAPGTAPPPTKGDES